MSCHTILVFGSSIVQIYNFYPDSASILTVKFFYGFSFKVLINVSFL